MAIRDRATPSLPDGLRLIAAWFEDAQRREWLKDTDGLEDMVSDLQQWAGQIEEIQRMLSTLCDCQKLRMPPSPPSTPGG